VSVLANLADQRLAVGVGHPVFGLDLVFGGDVRQKARFEVNSWGHGLESKG
jgi:hypothetical protein